MPAASRLRPLFDDGHAGPRVHHQPPARLSGEADPAFAGTDRFALWQDERTDHFAAKNSRQNARLPAAGDDHVLAGGRDDARRIQLAGHATLTQGRTAIAHITEDRLVQSRDGVNQLGVAQFRIPCVESIHIGQDHQQRGAEQVGDQCGQAIIVAERGDEFVDRHGVVFVDDRHGFEVEQGAERVPHVQVTGPIIHVVGRQEDLCGVAAMFVKRAIVDLDQASLANGRHRLQTGHVQRSLRQPQLAHAGADRPGTDQHDASSGVQQLADVLGQASNSGFVECAILVGEHSGPHLDDDRMGSRRDFLSQEVRHSSIPFANLSSIRVSWPHHPWGSALPARNVPCRWNWEKMTRGKLPSVVERHGAPYNAYACGRDAGTRGLRLPFMSEIHDECGVAAIYHLSGGETSPLCGDGHPSEVSRLLPRMLLDIQNRGQLAAGITSYHPQRDQLIDTHKDVGTVNEVFQLSHPGKAEAIMQEYAGSAAIGHVRYATCGRDDKSYAQPFERHHLRKHKWFSFAFNGQLANYAAFRDRSVGGWRAPFGP